MLNPNYESLITCCACATWATTLASRGYETYDELVECARRVWYQETPLTGWLEAFSAHPKLGDANAVRAKFSKFSELSSTEQSGILAAANDTVFAELADWNAKYEAKNGFIFILCALGKSANEVLQAIQDRYKNTPFAELKIAAQQQMSITELRLSALLQPAGAAQTVARRSGQLLGHILPESAQTHPLPRSPVTSHVLDTARGQPAAGLTVSLHRPCDGARLKDDLWAVVSEEATNADGRVTGLMQPGKLVPGLYRVKFDVQAYFQATGQGNAFYPQPSIDFVVTEDTRGQHFHIPLLICPFAYSTYRGS